MAIQQISVFVENKQGKLVSTVKTLAENGIAVPSRHLDVTVEK